MPFSRANGPGPRAVLWLQGCHLRCPGCINPETHDPGKGQRRSARHIFQEIAALKNIEGITISGGEPLEQIAALNMLLKCIRKETGLSILVFSGLTLTEITRLPLGKALLSMIDILVSGRYQQDRPANEPLKASQNQQVYFLTDRYTPEHLMNIPDTEILIGPDGDLEITGMKSLKTESQP